MGIFGLIKSIIVSAKEERKKGKLYLNMSKEDMASLSDEDLFEAAVTRTDNKIDGFDDIEEGFRSLNDSQKVLYVLNYFEAEVNNGGLCQFFVNQSRALAPYISGYMELVGAKEHKKLFDGFVSENKIDLADLSSFIIHRVKDYDVQTQRYPFDKYDDAFYDLEPIEAFLEKYVREHSEDF